MKNEFPIIKDVTYLDSAATTQKPNRVINKVSEYYQKYNSNVHRGLYSLGIESDKLYEKSRKLISSPEILEDKIFPIPKPSNRKYTRIITQSSLSIFFLLPIKAC